MVSYLMTNEGVQDGFDISFRYLQLEGDLTRLRKEYYRLQEDQSVDPHYLSIRLREISDELFTIKDELMTLHKQINETD